MSAPRLADALAKAHVVHDRATLEAAIRRMAGEIRGLSVVARHAEYRGGFVDEAGGSDVTSPLLRHSDGGCLIDGTEIALGLDPHLASDDGGDRDADMLTNCFEQGLGTNPGLADSDSDGINDGDLIVIDRAETFRDGHIVVARLDDQFTIKRFRLIDGRPWLYSANEDYDPIEVTEDTDFEIWGRVTFAITSLK